MLKSFFPAAAIAQHTSILESFAPREVFVLSKGKHLLFGQTA